MKDDFKKAGKNSQDCGSKCAGEAKPRAHEKSAHESSNERAEHQKTEHQKPQQKKW